MKKSLASRKENDFSKGDKLKLALRVGFLCSNPECMAPTVSASTEDSAATINVGKAAHIRAAMPGGKRYDPSMEPAQRKHIDNGIWLCGNCHDAVDSDEAEFTVEVLLAWKKQAEAEGRKRRGKPSKRPEAIGFFLDQSLQLNASALAKLGVTAVVDQGRVEYGLNRPADFQLTATQQILDDLLNALETHGEANVELNPTKAVLAPEDPDLLPFFPAMVEGVLMLRATHIPKSYYFSSGAIKHEIPFKARILKHPNRVVMTAASPTRALLFRITFTEDPKVTGPQGRGHGAQTTLTIDFKPSKGVDASSLALLRFLQFLGQSDQPVSMVDKYNRRTLITFDQGKFKTSEMNALASKAHILEMYLLAHDFLQVNRAIREDVPPSEVLGLLEDTDLFTLARMFTALENNLRMPMDLSVVYEQREVPDGKDLRVSEGVAQGRFQVQEPVYIGERLLTILHHTFDVAHIAFFDHESHQRIDATSLKQAVQEHPGSVRMQVQADSEIQFSSKLLNECIILLAMLELRMLWAILAHMNHLQGECQGLSDQRACLHSLCSNSLRASSSRHLKVRTAPRGCQRIGRPAC